MGDWPLVISLLAALSGAGGVGAVLGHVLARRTAVEERPLKIGHLTIEQEQAETDRLAQAVAAWEGLVAPLRAELAEVRERLTRSEQQHAECLALTAALTRELLHLQAASAGGRRATDPGA